MFETLRKATYFGLGAAAMSVDRMRQLIDDLIERGDVTAEEGKKMYEEYTSRVEEEGRSMDDRIKTQIRNALKDIGVADRAQIAMLESRIDALELRVNDLSAIVPKQESMEG